jgi:hypothetical protein
VPAEVVFNFWLSGKNADCVCGRRNFKSFKTVATNETLPASRRIALLRA